MKKLQKSNGAPIDEQDFEIKTDRTYLPDCKPSNERSEHIQLVSKEVLLKRISLLN